MTRDDLTEQEQRMIEIFRELRPKGKENVLEFFSIQDQLYNVNSKFVLLPMERGAKHREA